MAAPPRPDHVPGGVFFFEQAAGTELRTVR